MNTNFVKWHKHEDLETIAERIHHEYECEIPVDIDYIIEMMGIEIFDIHRLKEDFGLYGLIGKIKDKFVIFIQKGDLTLTNYNTNITLAEELSHYILHKEYFNSVKDFQGAYDFYIKIKKKSEMMMEFDAKHLAGALLVPRYDLKRKAHIIYKENKSIFSSLSESDCDMIIDHISTALRDVYRVPDAVIAYRLRKKVTGFKDFLKEEYKRN